MATTHIRTVVIDPGHGGTTRVGGSSPNNATGPNGLLEKDITLDIAQRVATLLGGRANVVLTRSADENYTLSDRARVARDANADIFLSLHLNGWRDANVDGTEAWIARGASPASRALARSVLEHVVGVTHARDRGVREADLGVLVAARHAPQTAATLIEIAFLTNPQEAGRLADTAYRQALAQGIVDGIEASGTQPTAGALAAGPARIDGVDAYTNDALTDWSELRSDGIRFLIHKATEHDRFKDSSYPVRRDRAHEAGAPFGGYHFYRANAGDTQQATNFIDAVHRVLPGDLPPTLDFEGGGTGADGLKASGITGADWLPRLTTFLDAVEKGLGRSPMIYTSRTVWQEFVLDDPALDWFGDYPLWVKHWHLPESTRYSQRMRRQPDLPAPWSDWTIWQYSGDFTPTEYTNLHKVNAKMDANVSNGGMAALRGLAGLGRPAVHGDTPRLVAYADQDGAIGVLTFLGYWLELDLTGQLGAHASGDVSACVIGNREFIAFRERANAHLFEIERDLSSGTSSLIDISVTKISATQSGTTAAVPAGDPVYFVDGSDRYLAYWGDDDHHYLLRYDAGADVWRPTDLTEAAGLDPASGSPACYAGGGVVHLVGRAGRDGELVDGWVDSAGTQRRNRIAESGAPAATYQPATYVAPDGVNHIVFRALRGEIFDVDDRSTARNLSRDAGGARPSAGSPAAFVFGGTAHVVYRGVDNLLYDLAGGAVSALPCGAAASDPAVVVTSDGAYVAFVDRDGNFQEAALTSSGWACNPIEPRT